MFLDWNDDDDGGPADGDFSDAGERVVSALPVSRGVNAVGFEVPSNAVATDAVLRFRLTEEGPSTQDGVGLELTGEVEDYLVVIQHVADPEVSLEGGGGMSIDANGKLVLTDRDGNLILIMDPDDVDSLVLSGGDEDDTVTLDWGVIESIGSVTVNLGNGFDTLIVNQGAGTPGTITYSHSDANSGTITDGVNSVAFSGLDPIVDNVDAANRVFTFSGAAETIVLSGDGDGANGNGYSFIDSEAAEQVVFKNPTSSLTINTGDGENVVVLGELDTPLAGTFGGIAVNGGTNPDSFTITPSADYAVAVDGAAPSGTCPGDALLIDTSTGAAVGTYGATAVSFTSGHLDVTHTEIESLGPADLEVTANYEILYATQDLAGGSELVITVTNNGPEEADCVNLVLDAALSVWLAGASAAESQGTFADPTWEVGALAVGESATLTITGFLDPSSPQEVTFTSVSAQDADGANNTATVELSLGFIMPTKAHVNAALYYERAASAGTYEALLVGLHQGSPGIEGAVWCKIPSETVASWPAPMPTAAVGNLFRPCSDGLPFPLHVNDIFEDASGTLWLSTWGSAGLYKSEDDGQSWEGAAPFGAGNNIVYDITEDAGGGVLYASGNNGKVIRSFNDGAVWQEVTGLPGVASDTPWSLVAHPTSAGIVYAGTHGNGVLVTEDFGFTWAVLEDGSDENQDLLDGNAGHVFDLAFSPEANFLYAGTGTGVWRANLTVAPTTFTGTWTLIGPNVTLHDASAVTPQIRALAFTGNGAGAPADDLIAGSWGFGAFLWDDADGSTTHSQMTLKEGQVLFVAGSTNGQVFAGTSSGGTILLSPSGATSTAAEPVRRELPEGFTLSQNYPNPFNPVTNIGFALPEARHVRLCVFDNLGREVAVLVDQTVEPGHHTATFDARGLPSGTYLYRLETGTQVIARILVLMK